MSGEGDGKRSGSSGSSSSRPALGGRQVSGEVVGGAPGAGGAMPAYSGSPIPNIPPRHGSPHDEILRSPVMFPRSLTQDSRAAHNSGGGGGGGVSEVPTPVNLAELDSLPLSDEQKARIIERQ